MVDFVLIDFRDVIIFDSGDNFIRHVGAIIDFDALNKLILFSVVLFKFIRCSDLFGFGGYDFKVFRDFLNKFIFILLFSFLNSSIKFHVFDFSLLYFLSLALLYCFLFKERVNRSFIMVMKFRKKVVFRWWQFILVKRFISG